MRVKKGDILITKKDPFDSARGFAKRKVKWVVLGTSKNAISIREKDRTVGHGVFPKDKLDKYFIKAKRVKPKYKSGDKIIIIDGPCLGWERKKIIGVIKKKLEPFVYEVKVKKENGYHIYKTNEINLRRRR